MKTDKEIRLRATEIAEKSIQGGEFMSNDSLSPETKKALKQIMIGFYTLGYKDGQEDKA